MPIEPVYKVVGQRLRMARTENGLTQDEVAEGAGLTRPLLSKLENGRFRVQVHVLLRLARALETPVAFFLPEAPRREGGR